MFKDRATDARLACRLAAILIFTIAADARIPIQSSITGALDEARRLGQLDGQAYGGTKLAFRQATIDRVLPTLATASV